MDALYPFQHVDVAGNVTICCAACDLTGRGRHPVELDRSRAGEVEFVCPECGHMGKVTSLSPRWAVAVVTGTVRMPFSEKEGILCEGVGSFEALAQPTLF